MRMAFPALTALLSLIGSSLAIAASTERWVEGIKYPNSPEEGSAPVRYTAPAFVFSDDKDAEGLPGFSELLPFALGAPDQEEAGSCLYMSLTGAAEWWYSKLHPELRRSMNGPTDLSERYLMNAAGKSRGAAEVQAFNWKTDSIYVFNSNKKAALNSAYPFRKGWYKEGANGNNVPADANDEAASYGTAYNWIDETESIPDEGWVTLPEFSRDVVFADPASNQWNVGVMPGDIVERVKAALTEFKAPVQIIYNHFGYWHSVFILGFDDARDSQQCRFTTKNRAYFESEAKRLRKEAADANTDTERRALLARAKTFESHMSKYDAAFERGGGCAGKGMFYVRDSIYNDDAGPLYDYDSSRTGEETRLGPVVVHYEYEWLKYLANHAIQIRVK